MIFMGLNNVQRTFFVSLLSLKDIGLQLCALFMSVSGKISALYGLILPKNNHKIAYTLKFSKHLTMKNEIFIGGINGKRK